MLAASTLQIFEKNRRVWSDVCNAVLDRATGDFCNPCRLKGPPSRSQADPNIWNGLQPSPYWGSVEVKRL
jgi:hypothetical protein